MPLTPIWGFLGGSLAAMGAVTITNPLEVVKTRIQLQGQRGSKPYSNIFQAIYLIGRNEGLLSLQKGLSVAYVYQILLNGVRVGNYEYCKTSFNRLLHPNKDPSSNENMGVNILAGGVTGAIGAAISSPLYLIKTRLQSFSAGSSKTSVGTQNRYSNFVTGLISIYKNEGGIRALFRGCSAAIVRTTAGSMIQLPLYNFSKEMLVSYGENENEYLYLEAAGITGLGVGFVLNPFDVVLTRVYNEKRGVYSGPLDCLVKTVRNEGITALMFKGIGPSMIRMGPHTVLCLFFMEKTMPLMSSLQASL